MAELEKNLQLIPTKKTIQNSLLEILATTPFEKITVKQLTAQAFISRAHFYYHFEDKYAVLEALENEFLEKFKSILSENTSFLKEVHDEEDILNLLYENTLKNMEFFQRNALFLTRIMGKNGDPYFFDRLYQIYENHFIIALPNNFSEYHNQDVKNFLIFITKGIAATIEFWIKSDFEKSAENMTTIIVSYLHSSLLTLDQLYSQ
ncbi:TetR/AcrR family transcriptional regulator C-terminal domain-containing protein [Listeria ilorinensis]|uniref:TetR/AcrR family transcriptional regulator C-terminal domain-containing protein n=1 Tax=Listeria ilorinensis TaxID=2867439 RepID=UPI001EF67CD0|nr:TetR/AcrR family transcriptional regulator C-terminal domain-containing protein [Listeria ilorinensis]